MRRFGVEVQRDVSAAAAPRFTIAAGARYRAPGAFAIEGDASSASYFLALGALAGGPVRVLGMGSSSLQGDLRFAEVMTAMGARVEQGDDWTEVGSPGTRKSVGSGTGVKVSVNLGGRRHSNKKK